MKKKKNGGGWFSLKRQLEQVGVGRKIRYVMPDLQDGNAFYFACGRDFARSLYLFHTHNKNFSLEVPT